MVGLSPYRALRSQSKNLYHVFGQRWTERAGMEKETSEVDGEERIKKKDKESTREKWR